MRITFIYLLSFFCFPFFSSSQTTAYPIEVIHNTAIQDVIYTERGFVYSTGRDLYLLDSMGTEMKISNSSHNTIGGDLTSISEGWSYIGRDNNLGDVYLSAIHSIVNTNDEIVNENYLTYPDYHLVGANFGAKDSIFSILHDIDHFLFITDYIGNTIDSLQLGSSFDNIAIHSNKDIIVSNNSEVRLYGSDLTLKKTISLDRIISLSYNAETMMYDVLTDDGILLLDESLTTVQIIDLPDYILEDAILTHVYDDHAYLLSISEGISKISKIDAAGAIIDEHVSS